MEIFLHSYANETHFQFSCAVESWPFLIILHFRKLFAEAEEEQRKVCLLRENVYCNFKTRSLKVGEQFLMLDDMWPRNNQWESVLLGKKYFS